jgi:hypothetical protein
MLRPGVTKFRPGPGKLNRHGSQPIRRSGKHPPPPLNRSACLFLDEVFPQLRAAAGNRNCFQAGICPAPAPPFPCRFVPPLPRKAAQVVPRLSGEPNIAPPRDGARSCASPASSGGMMAAGGRKERTPRQFPAGALVIHLLSYVASKNVLSCKIVSVHETVRIGSDCHLTSFLHYVATRIQGKCRLVRPTASIVVET